MDPRYEDYYERAFRDVPHLWPRRYVPAFEIRDMVMEATGAAERPVRADAKLFLYLNMLQMVVQPIVAIEGRPVEFDLFGEARQDLAVIVNQAEGISAEQNEEEISGHTVVDALSRAWGELRLTQPWRWER